MDRLNKYVYRGTKPRPMPAPAPKRISTPGNQRLSTIIEGGNTNSNNNNTSNGTNGSRSGPANPSLAQRLLLGNPPRASFDNRPPSYASADSVGPGELGGVAAAEKRPHESWVRSQLNRRGGWKRLALIVGLVLVAITALAVGLGVGLSNNSGDGNGSGNDNKSGPPKNQPFPAGAWSFDTNSVQTAKQCTPIASTWRCSTFLSFQWIIGRGSSSSSSEWVISAGDNPFGAEFHDAPLEIHNANTSNERYTFSIQHLQKQVWPAVSLSGDNNRTTCFFNDTTLSATLYTQRQASLSARLLSTRSMSSSSSSNNGPMYQAWAYAVSISEIAHGGPHVPECYRTWNGKAVGEPLNLSTDQVAASSECSCRYQT